MKAVITRQKYKCDFCKKRGIKTAMEKHERRCFRNPNRFCDYCKNKGETDEGVDIYTHMVPCPYCSQRDLAKEKAIKEYEAGLTPKPSEENVQVPF